MIISEDNSSAEFQINAYEPGKITVNKTIYSRSMLISAKQFAPDWKPQSLESLTREDLQKILEFKPEIVIFGTGLRFKKPSSLLQTFFSQHHIGVEYMDTHAACRTYVALVSEGRKIVAALLIE